MQIGFIGLGRMGGNMVKALLRDSHDVVAFDRDPDAVKSSSGDGAKGANSLQELVQSLTPPRRVWVMVPAGAPTDSTIKELGELCESGDIIIDGGNSNFRDSKRHSEELSKQDIGFCDIGVSGGVWGLKVGYCMMAGGERKYVDAIKPVLDSLAPPNGWDYFGPAGAGHFVKMVHNGIEYGMLAAYGEGFEILKESEYDIDLLKCTEVWQQGSVIRSWLLELAGLAYKREGNDLEHIAGYVEDSGEGRWTVAEAINENVPAPIITLSLLRRISSRQKESYSAKVIAALRNEFGGHEIKSE